MGEISFPPFLERYRVSETARSSHVFELRLTDDLPQPKGTQIAHRADIDVYKVNGLDAGAAEPENGGARLSGLGDPVEVDSYMFPFCRERAQYDESVRLTPEECADYHMQTLYRQNPSGFHAYLRDAGSILSGGCFPGHDRMVCRAGTSSCWIDWQGNVSPCFAMQKDAIPLAEHGFSQAWEMLVEWIAQLRLSDKCSSCTWQQLCPSCAGRALCETGHADGTPEYLCSFMECIKKGFHKA